MTGSSADRSEQSAEKAVHLLVFGKVQGVFFRSNLKKVCDNAGVMGWVRNKPDGSVEAILQGGEDGIRAVLDWSKQGPERAQVSRIETRESDYSSSMKGFEIVY